jgi:hypothetical protein
MPSRKRKDVEPESSEVLLHLESFKRFKLVRDKDISGVSGTGVVAIGVVFPSHKAVVEWQTVTPSTTIFTSIVDVESIHGHDGATHIEYID